MNHRIKNIILFNSLILAGCAKPQFIRTGGDTQKEYGPTAKESVEIYRSAEPSWEYREIGTITFDGFSNLKKIFEKIRAEAAKRGAHAVVKFDLESEAKQVLVSESRTDSKGRSHTIHRTERRVTFTSSGTLVRKK